MSTIFISIFLICFSFPIILGSELDTALSHTSHHRNVLMIIIDDLRADHFGSYNERDGATKLTPHMDKLAGEIGSTLFSKAYCQYALCSPSRMSFLTGTRPDTTSVYDLHTKLRTNLPNAISILQHFRENFYFTKGIGKIWHRNHNDPLSWSVEQPWIQRPHYALPLNMKNAQIRHDEMMKGLKEIDIDRTKRRITPPVGPIIELYDIEPQLDNIYSDGVITLATIKSLEEAKYKLMNKIDHNEKDYNNNNDKNNHNDNINDNNDRDNDKNNTSTGSFYKGFFISAGYMKPHLPWCLPKHYYDDVNTSSVPFLSELYDKKSIRCSIPNNSPSKTIDIPGTEMNMYIKKKDIFRNNDGMLNMRRAYAACVLYIDKQIGLLMKSLVDLNLKESTLVVIMSDHGFKLGEHGSWTKGSVFEEDTRVPLLFNIPPSFIHSHIQQHSHHSPHNQHSNHNNHDNQHSHSQHDHRHLGDEDSLDVVRHESIVELVDVFPTLIELCDLPPLPIGGQKLDGKSLAPLLLNDIGKRSSGTSDSVDSEVCRGAFSQTLYGGVMGYSMRILDCSHETSMNSDKSKRIHHGRSGYRLTVWVKYASKMLHMLNTQEKHDARIEALAQVLIPFLSSSTTHDTPHTLPKKKTLGDILKSSVCFSDQDTPTTMNSSWISQALHTHFSSIKSTRTVKGAVTSLQAVELYDLTRDPYETANVAHDDKYAVVLGELVCKWVRGWGRAD